MTSSNERLGATVASVCKITDKLLFRCQKKSQPGAKKVRRRCNFNVSAREGSFFEKSHLPLEKYFYLVSCLLILKPPRQELIESETGISRRSVVDWYSFCREVFYDHMTNHSVKLGGPSVIVEIDEAKFGKRKYNRGRRVEGQWVFGGVERDSGKTFLVPVESRDTNTLLEIIREWILPGSIVYSDCWKSYNCLNREGFQHLTVNHSLHFVDPETGVHTNTVERNWREVRYTIPRFGVKKDHFVGYLAEFQFKYRYKKKWERLHHFFLAAAKLYPPRH